jgi:hypothetical protein
MLVARISNIQRDKIAFLIRFRFDVAVNSATENVWLLRTIRNYLFEADVPAYRQFIKQQHKFCVE